MSKHRNIDDEFHHSQAKFFTVDAKSTNNLKIAQALPQSSLISSIGSQRNPSSVKSNDDIHQLHLQLASLQRENKNLLAEKEELEVDKDSLVNYAHHMKAQADMAVIHAQELQKSNKTMMDGVSTLKLENSKLRRKLLSYEERGISDVSAMQRKFQQLLADKDAEIRALKNAVANDARSRSHEAALSEKKFDKERESYLAEIHCLKNQLSQKKDSNVGYNQKLINVLETSHSSRHEEIRKLKKEMKKLKRELDQRRSYRSSEKDVSLSHDEVSSFKKLLTSTHNDRNQMMVNIVTSLESFSCMNEKQSRRRPFTRKRQEELSTKSDLTPPDSFRAEAIKSIEGLYEAEVEWHNVCVRKLDNMLTKPTSAKSNLKRSVSPKKRVSHDRSLQMVRMKQNSGFT